MARKKSNSFNAFDEYDNSPLKETSNTKSDKQEVISNSNTSTITKDVIQESKPVQKEQKPRVVRSGKTKTVSDISKSLKEAYEEKVSKPTVEETHKRASFLFRRDLEQRLDMLADGRRGFKTMFMNKAIEALLDEYED